jgi:hypothetical protein
LSSAISSGTGASALTPRLSEARFVWTGKATSSLA